ncbi:universal stress protein [soil metagenome]
MDAYKHVLLALDLHPDCDQVAINKAIVLVKLFNAKLTILHAVEHVSAYGMAQASPMALDVEEQMLKDAEQQLLKLKQTLAIPNTEIVVTAGSPKNVIIDKVEELKVDLIVVGSHGRHGLSLLLGSTANALLHHATCDVLAVRIK